MSTHTTGPSMIVFVRDYKDRVESANNLLVSDSNRAFIQEVLDICDYKGRWTTRMMHDPHLAEEYNEDTSIVFCGQGCVALQDCLLNNIRGYYHDRAVYTFGVRDCQDHRKVEEHGIFDDEDEEEGYGKDKAGTRWQNYRFWFIQDVRKAVRRPAVQFCKPTIRLTADQMVDWIKHKRRVYSFFDIETRNNQCICFSISDGSECVSYLCYNYSNTLQPGTDRVFAALARSFQYTIPVVHNAMYDIPFMAFFHGIPIPPQVYCTMASHHRLYPEADKSLAHCISLYTNYSNHKVLSINETHNVAQDEQLLFYNSCDVQVLPAIHDAQSLYTSASNKLLLSVQQVNQLIPIYAKMGMRGIRVDSVDQIIRRKYLERKLAQYDRILKLSLGRWNFSPASSAQTVNYFHNTLGYPPQGLTPAGNPSLSGDLLYELAAKHNNPMITLTILYRETAKELSMLDIKFPPYEGEFKI